jgi:hypothetical protein
MNQKGELIASVFRQSDGRVVLARCHGGRVGLNDCPTVGAAMQLAEEAWSGLAWEEVMPGEWLAREAS